MKTGMLSAHFKGFGMKRLSAVETDPYTSNQHEFNGVSSYKKVFGLDKMELPATFLFLSDTEDKCQSESGTITWYDARENHPTRSEYRLYYSSSTVMPRAQSGDLCIVALQQDDTALVLIADEGSSIEAQLIWLFGVESSMETGVLVADEVSMDAIEITEQTRRILEEIGIDTWVEDGDVDVEPMLKHFNGGWPTTTAMSEYARRLAGQEITVADSDGAIRRWFEMEERLFRAYERVLVESRVRSGFSTVDDFTAYALSVLNRRKSRAGHALENHIEHVFQKLHVPYVRNGKTEQNKRPDFIFPGIEEYHQAAHPYSHLRMLAVKTSCKDRWRQILNEADRITVKHLLTLDRVLSVNQLNEMSNASVVLVSPYGLTSGSASGPVVSLKIAEFLALVG
ncbi:MAG: restriction endonuclease [Candidatus Kapabacteria bacterium]|nr:restriction endonuclease [Candidatus Kapabacteria bacterium]